MGKLEFDEAKHEYRLEGALLPSVTQVLKPLQDFSTIPEDILERSANFGTAVHLATALWDQNDLDLDSVDVAIVPYLEAWKRFRDETKITFEAIETQVVSEKYRYAGTLDRIGFLNEKPTVIDIKTGLTNPLIGVQLAGYLVAWNETHVLKATKRASVSLRKDGTYRLDWWEDKADWACFLALLQITNWQLAHGNQIERRNHGK